jgi:hypothetical protein
MRGLVLASAFAAVALAGFALAVRGPAVAQPTTVTIVLPPPDVTFPGGDEAEPARRHCLVCHSSDYVFTQPKLTRKQWTAEVTKMVKVYGAVVPDADATAIVDYLVAQNGKP